MKNIFILFLFMGLLLKSNASFCQCGVTVNPSSVIICQGDSVLLTATAFTSGYTVDQQDTNYNAGTSARTLPGYSMAQTFTTAVSGTLVKIKIGFFNFINGTGVLNIYSGSGITGTLLYTSNVNVYCAGGNCLDSFNVTASVVAGNMYTFQFIPGAGIPDPYGVQADANGTYANGSMLIIDPSGVYPMFDMRFETDVEKPSYYLWSNGSTNATTYANSAGYYSVQITDSSGCLAIDSSEISIATAPVVDLGNDTSICSTCSLTLTAGAGFSTYLWSDGSTLSFITISAPGVYIVTVTNNYGCTATDTIEVTLQPVGLSTVNLQPDFTWSFQNDIINVQFTNPESASATIELLDANGRLLISENPTNVTNMISIPMRDFASGFYIFRITSDKICFIKKFSKG